MLDTGVGIAAMVLVCAAFLYLGISKAWGQRQSAEEYTVSRNHAPVNVGVAVLVASMFGTWVLLSPDETGANLGIVSLVGYAIGIAGIPVMYMFVGPRLRQLMLAMSTLDTLMNGLASGLATDLAGMGVSRGGLMLQARAVTAVLAVPAIIVAAQGFSVLYVFLIADLLGATIAVPMLVGLYSTRIRAGRLLAPTEMLSARISPPPWPSPLGGGDLLYALTLSLSRGERGFQGLASLNWDGCGSKIGCVPYHTGRAE